MLDIFVGLNHSICFDETHNTKICKVQLYSSIYKLTILRILTERESTVRNI